MLHIKFQCFPSKTWENTQGNMAKSADMTPKPPCDGRLNKLHFPEIEDFCSVKDLTKRDEKVSCVVEDSLYTPQVLMTYV